jgi:hypothetical protein
LISFEASNFLGAEPEELAEDVAIVFRETGRRSTNLRRGRAEAPRKAGEGKHAGFRVIDGDVELPLV